MSNKGSPKLRLRSPFFRLRRLNFSPFGFRELPTHAIKVVAFYFINRACYRKCIPSSRSPVSI